MRAVSNFIILLLLGFITYEHQDYIQDQSKFLFYDPAATVLNANLPEDDTVFTFQSEIYGKIFLLAGNEPNYGYRHILARHTTRYFINFKNKNDATMFDDDVEGKDIILGIKEFYKHCIDVDAYNRRIDKNIVYVGYTKIKEKNVKCLLAVRKEGNQIITFYPLREKRVQEILEEIREQERVRRSYYYD